MRHNGMPGMLVDIASFALRGPEWSGAKSSVAFDFESLRRATTYAGLRFQNAQRQRV